MELVFKALANPYTVWKNYGVEMKQRFFYLIFSENLVYDKNEGYRTAVTTPLYTAFKSFTDSNSPDVEVGGIGHTSFS